MSDSDLQNRLRIFLCHSSDDKPIVRELYQQLIADEFQPWLDEKDLLPGQEWAQEIHKRVRKSDVVIICLSKRSIKKAGFVQKEIRIALDTSDEQPEDTIFIIPIRLDECEVPDSLKRWQWVDFFQEDGYKQLTRSLRHRQKSISNQAVKKTPESSLQIKESSQQPIQPRSSAPSLISKVKRIFSSVSNALAIDCGSVQTRIYVHEHGIVVNEPSVIAINTTSKTVEAAGKEAKEMMGRTAPSIMTYCPVKDGVVTNINLVSKMLNYFISRAPIDISFNRARVVVAKPTELTNLEQRALAEFLYDNKAAEVYLIENGLCAALGAGLSITEPHGNMVIDIGESTTDITIISRSEIVFSRAVRVAGAEMDEAIIQYVKRKYNLLISERKAETIKIQIGSALQLDEVLSINVIGRDLVEGTLKTISLSNDEIREALTDSVLTIINAVRVTLERTPPDLVADIIERGIVLTGGGALLNNFDKQLSMEIGIPVYLADDPVSSVVLGAGKMLQNVDFLKHKLLKRYKR
jgi:rod shape-determining protein MreB and related proteins